MTVNLIALCIKFIVNKFYVSRLFKLHFILHRNLIEPNWFSKSLLKYNVDIFTQNGKYTASHSGFLYRYERKDNTGFSIEML